MLHDLLLLFGGNSDLHERPAGRDCNDLGLCGKGLGSILSNRSRSRGPAASARCRQVFDGNISAGMAAGSRRVANLFQRLEGLSSDGGDASVRQNFAVENSSAVVRRGTAASRAEATGAAAADGGSCDQRPRTAATVAQYGPREIETE